MRAPDKTGLAGSAWLVPNKSDVPDHAATLAQWLVRVPGAHPFWQHWCVCMIHLRDLPGVKPAHKRYPAAEFEFLIASIDPTSMPEPDPDRLHEGVPFMSPIDVIEQFHGVSDRDAKRICEAAVNAILAGTISPDQDYRAAWKQVLASTVGHFRAGGHLES